MARRDAKPPRAGVTGPATPAAVGEEEIAAIAKRHRVSPAIVREVMRRTGATERAVIEREIERSKARR